MSPAGCYIPRLLPQQTTVHASHQLCDRIEAAIAGNLKQTSITIHVEPKESHPAEGQSSRNPMPTRRGRYSKFSVVDLGQDFRRHLLEAEYPPALVILEDILCVGAGFQRHQFVSHRAEYVRADDVKRLARIDLG